MIIFGIDFAGTESQQQEKLKKLVEPVKRFALFPKRMKTYEWVWLSSYYEYYKLLYDSEEDKFKRPSDRHYGLLFDSYKSEKPVLYAKCDHDLVEVRVTNLGYRNIKKEQLYEMGLLEEPWSVL